MHFLMAALPLLAMPRRSAQQRSQFRDRMRDVRGLRRHDLRRVPRAVGDADRREAVGPRGEGEPYYPVPRPENTALYRRYKALAEQTPGVHFVGRLATYQYYNMDQVVAQALKAFRDIAARDAATSKRPPGVAPDAAAPRQAVAGAPTAPWPRAHGANGHGGVATAPLGGEGGA